MRKIKFRIFLDKMVYFGFKDIESGFLNTVLGKVCIECDEIDHKIMQYTSLEDKNGKEIYEGDLFYYTCDSDNLQRLCKVIYCPDKMGFDVVQIYENREEILAAFVDGWECYETPKYLRLIEIIGNIYENPELIKEE